MDPDYNDEKIRSLSRRIVRDDKTALCELDELVKKINEQYHDSEKKKQRRNRK